MKNYTKAVLASLFITLLSAACSRPTAYFQPTAHGHFSTVVKPVAAANLTGEAVAAEPAMVATTAPAAEVTRELDKAEALVRNDKALASDRTIQKRISRVRTMLAAATGKATAGTKKMGVVERLMVKKMNRTITRQLAPESPAKAMAIKGILALGAVILLAGIILLLVSTAGTTAATAGVIGIIGGVILLLIGLI